MMLLRLLGGLFVALGAIGLFLPIWPTTIFWILAALCFARSSPEARDWIYARPGIGPQIEAFIERGTLNRASKVAAIIGMSLAGAMSTYALRNHLLWLALLLVILLGASLYVITRPRG